MTNIEDMIKDLCPNGVEWKELGEVCEFKRGQSLTSKNAFAGDVPVISGGQKPAFMHNISNREGETIVIAGSGAYAGFVSYWKQPVFVSDAFSVDIKNPREMNTRYVFHFLLNNQQKIYATKLGAGIPHVYGRNIAKFKIPIPPLKVQEEIVKILDKFTDYVTELTTELTLRQKQYSFYRDKLLSFEDEVYKVEVFKLSDIATIKARIGWQGLTRKEYLDKGKYYLVTGTDFVNGKINFNTCHFVERERYMQDSNIQLKIGDVLVTKDGTLGKVAYVNHLPGPTTLNSGVFVVRKKENNNVSSRYLYHYLNSPYLMEYAKSKLTGGTIKHLNQSVIIDLPIPIPSLDIQSRIVQVLDNFDTVCNDLNIGLPKEIELRQKQYDYFRDKLLTFTAEGVYSTDKT